MIYFKKPLKYIVFTVFILFSFAAFAEEDGFLRAIESDDLQAFLESSLKGSDPNLPDLNGMTPLMRACLQPAPKVALALLKIPQLKINMRSPAQETALMFAALKGQTAVVRELLKLKAEVNQPGWTALHYAASGGHVEIVEMLLDQHAYIDAESPNGTTPLMMAARDGNLATVKVLLEAGADPILLNQVKMKAFDFAIAGKKHESALAISAKIRSMRPKGEW